jgi:acyl carrier protein
VLNRKWVYKKVAKVMSEFTDIKERDIKLSSTLKEDLGLTSFDVVSLTMAFEEVFSVTISDLRSNQIETVEDIVNIIERFLAEKQKNHKKEIKNNMKSHKKTVLMPFLRNSTPKKLEKWLKQETEEGWHPKKINALSFFAMTFTKADPCDCRYAVDITAYKGPKLNRQLSGDFNWELIGKMTNIIIWRQSNFESQESEILTVTDKQEITQRDRKFSWFLWGFTLFVLLGVLINLVVMIVWDLPQLFN